MSEYIQIDVVIAHFSKTKTKTRDVLISRVLVTWYKYDYLQFNVFIFFP